MLFYCYFAFVNPVLYIVNHVIMLHPMLQEMTTFRWEWLKQEVVTDFRGISVCRAGTTERRASPG